MQTRSAAAPETSFAARLADLQASISTAHALRPDSPDVVASAHRALRAFGFRPSTESAFATFSGLLATRGVRDALAYLLQLSDYRFIGIFRFENGWANAAVHFDRLKPEVRTPEAVPDTATYCCYIRDSLGAFTTVHAAADPRLDAHVARDVVQSYCGIPVMDAQGVLIGTLCHYDLVPRNPDQLDSSLLLQVASALGRSGVVPPYPRAPKP